MTYKRFLKELRKHWSGWQEGEFGDFQKSLGKTGVDVMLPVEDMSFLCMPT